MNLSKEMRTCIDMSAMSARIPRMGIIRKVMEIVRNRSIAVRASRQVGAPIGRRLRPRAPACDETLSRTRRSLRSVKYVSLRRSWQSSFCGKKNLNLNFEWRHHASK